MSVIAQNWALQNPSISMATATFVLNPHSPFHTIHLKAVLPTGWNSWLQQLSRSGKTHLSPECSAVPTELRNHRQEPSGLGKMASK